MPLSAGAAWALDPPGSDAHTREGHGSILSAKSVMTLSTFPLGHWTQVPTSSIPEKARSLDMVSSTSLDGIFKQLVELFEAKLEGASTLEVDTAIGNRMDYMRSKAELDQVNEGQTAILRVIKITIDEWSQLTKAERSEVREDFRHLMALCHGVGK
ncbi:MAG: hypothetical protein Q9191_007049 [Dirinaria sp. TL-2023a]